MIQSWDGPRLTMILPAFANFVIPGPHPFGDASHGQRSTPLSHRQSKMVTSDERLHGPIRRHVIMSTSQRIEMLRSPAGMR
jgi:hypothetical protein